MFVLQMERSYDDLDEAIVACESPPGAYVVDVETNECFGPTCWEEIDEAKARIAARSRSSL